MLSYETAKQLKDAGFKCEHDMDNKTSSFCTKCPYYEDYQPYVGPERKGMAEICYPTLSELIEACGNEFMITNECDVWEAWKGSQSSFVRMGEGGAQYEASGNSPEEAVAALWLAVNNK